jgi:hypothetical protein
MLCAPGGLNRATESAKIIEDSFAAALVIKVAPILPFTMTIMRADHIWRRFSHGQFKAIP